MKRNLQRLAALALLVIFALSIVPAAWAENPEGGMPEREKQLRIKKDAVLERVKEKVEKVPEEMREKAVEVKEKYAEARQAFLEKKERLSELKERARCTEDTAECGSKKQDLRKGVRDHLLKTAELIDSSLQKLLDRVENSKVLSAEDQQEALARLTELEMQLTAKVDGLKALPDTVSNEELRTHIRELKDLWHKVRKEQRWVITQLTNHKQDNLIEVYVRYGDRLEAQINKLAEEGTDVAELRELLAQYREKVEELKVAQDEAKAAWLKAKEAGADDAMEKARELQQAFREKAAAAKAILRDLLLGLKEVRRERMPAGVTEPEASTEELNTEAESAAPATAE